MKVIVNRNDWQPFENFELRILQPDPHLSQVFMGQARSGMFQVRATYELKPIEMGEDVPPMLRFDESTAQQLMDELWRVGVRPKSGEGSLGQLGATERHLADVKALLWKTLKMPARK